jgi:hypothetical protein
VERNEKCTQSFGQKTWLRPRDDNIKTEFNEMGMRECELDSSGLVIRNSEHRNEASDSKRDEEFIDQLREYQFLKQDPHPWGQSSTKCCSFIFKQFME